MENLTTYSNPISIFISRELQPQSPLRQLKGPIVWTAQSMIDFKPVSFEFPNHIRRLFFYSRKGVQYFIEQLDEKQLGLVKACELFCMGKGTATALEEKGIRASRVGKGNPSHWAEWLIENKKLKGLCFIKGVQSRQSVEKCIWNLTDNTTDALEVYSQKPNPISISPQSMYIFTSPLNVQTFAEVNSIPSDAQIIAIGPTTKETITEIWRDINVHIPIEPSEESIAKFLSETFSL